MIMGQDFLAANIYWLILIMHEYHSLVHTRRTGIQFNPENVNITYGNGFVAGRFGVV